MFSIIYAGGSSEFMTLQAAQEFATEILECFGDHVNIYPYPACVPGLDIMHRFELTTRAGMVVAETCANCGHTEKYN